MVKGQVLCELTNGSNFEPFYQDISLAPSGNPFKFGRNLYLDSKMNGFYFFGLRSQAKVTVTSRFVNRIYQECQYQM